VLQAFLDQHDPDWEATQTVAPGEVATSSAATTSIVVAWTPTRLHQDTGGYRVYYSTVSGGPYTYFGMTPTRATPTWP